MTQNFSNFSHLNSSSNGVTEDLRIVKLVFAIVLSVLATIGNILTIFHIMNRGLYKQVCNLYILNLGINNLITSTISIPILGVSFYMERWIFGDVFCYIFPYLINFTTCSETNALLLITINRYFKVVRPVIYIKLFKKKYFNGLLIGSSWLVYMVIQALPLTKVWGKFENNKHKRYCTYGSDSETKIFIVSLSVFILLTNLPLHVYCYGSILWKFKNSKKRMIISQSCNNYTREPKVNMSLVRMVIVIILCFALTHAPFLAVNAIDPTLKLTGMTVYTVVAYIALSHTVINPIVYVLMNKQFFNNTIKGMRCQC